MNHVSPDIEDGWLIDSFSVLPDGTLRIIFHDPIILEKTEIAELMLSGLTIDYFRDCFEHPLNTFKDLSEAGIIAAAHLNLSKLELQYWACQDIDKRENILEMGCL